MFPFHMNLSKNEDQPLLKRGPLKNLQTKKKEKLWIKKQSLTLTLSPKNQIKNHL